MQLATVQHARAASAHSRLHGERCRCFSALALEHRATAVAPHRGLQQQHCRCLTPHIQLLVVHSTCSKTSNRRLKGQRRSCTLQLLSLCFCVYLQYACLPQRLCLHLSTMGARFGCAAQQVSACLALCPTVFFGTHSAILQPIHRRVTLSAYHFFVEPLVASLASCGLKRCAPARANCLGACIGVLHCPLAA